MYEASFPKKRGSFNSLSSLLLQFPLHLHILRSNLVIFSWFTFRFGKRPTTNRSVAFICKVQEVNIIALGLLIKDCLLGSAPHLAEIFLIAPCQPNHLPEENSSSFWLCFLLVLDLYLKLFIAIKIVRYLTYNWYQDISLYPILSHLVWNEWMDS